MTGSLPPVRLQHHVAGHKVSAEPARWIHVPSRTDGTPEVAVPVASTGEVDQYVEEISKYLARWMARSASERAHLVTALADAILSVRPAIQERAAALGLPPEALTAQLERSASAIGEIAAHATEHPVAPMGIVAFVIDSDRAGRLMLPMVAEVLVHGGVVIVTSTPFLAAATFSVSGRLAAALPPGVFNEVYGDDETADALVSNPLVAAVFVDGDDDTIDHLIQLAAVHRKPGVAYTT